MSIIITVLITSIGFEYLVVDPVAHRVGMGYALYGDGYSVQYNPGGLAFSYSPHYSLSYLNYIGGTHFGFLGYESKQIGVGVRYFNSGSMKKTDALGNEYGSFGVHFIDLNLGKGFVYKDIGLGVSLKTLYANIDTLYALGIGFDLGAIYILSKPKVQIGVAVKNIGTSVKPFITTNEIFPYEINVGAVKQFNQAWIGLDLVKPALTGFGLRIGGAYALTPIFILKTSYNSLLSTLRTESNGLDILTGLTIGITITTKNFLLDYSYSPYFDFGSGHRISISLGG